MLTTEQREAIRRKLDAPGSTDYLYRLLREDAYRLLAALDEAEALLARDANGTPGWEAAVYEAGQLTVVNHLLAEERDAWRVRAEGAEQRARMALDAKDDWIRIAEGAKAAAERAEARGERYRAALASLVTALDGIGPWVDYHCLWCGTDHSQRHYRDCEWEAARTALAAEAGAGEAAGPGG